MWQWIRTKLALGLMHFIKILVDFTVVVGIFCEAVIVNQITQFIYEMNGEVQTYAIAKLLYLVPAVYFIWRVVVWWIISQGQGIRPALMARLRIEVFKMFRLV